jgi:hypothetical protein
MHSRGRLVREGMGLWQLDKRRLVGNSLEAIHARAACLDGEESDEAGRLVLKAIEELRLLHRTALPIHTH